MKRKIVFFTPTLNIGGIERVFLTYAGLLAELGHDVIYLVCYDDGTFLNQLNSKVRLYNLGTNKLRKSLWKLASFIHSQHPDSIIAANSSTTIVLLAKWLSLRKTKIITSQHNYINIEATSWMDKRLIWRIYNMCDSVIAISDGICSLLHAHKVNPRKIHLIYNPVDSNKIIALSKQDFIRPSSRYILFVGRLAEIKNISLLISAFSKLPEQYDDMQLVIVGDGPLREKLSLETSHKEIYQKVLFTGPLSNPYPYMKHADIIALTSLSEAFPTVLLEALTFGKTIVSTPTKGSLEILGSGEYGYITRSFDDENELTAMLDYACKNPLEESLLKNYVMSRFGARESVYRLESLLTDTQSR